MPDWRERDDSDRGYSGGGGGGGDSYSYDRERRDYRSDRGGYDRNGSGGGSRGPPRIDPATAKTEVFEVEADKVKFIIGRGGNKIREIQDRCRVSVQIDKARNENGANNVSVMGDQLNIDRARDMINTIINDDRRDREDDRRREGNGLAF